MSPEDCTALAIVKMGYGVGSLPDTAPIPPAPALYECMDFRVKVTLEAVPAALRAIGEYNGFKPGSASMAVLDAAMLAEWTGIYVGREGSPVIYLRGLEDHDDRLRAAEMFAAAGADEVSCSPDGELRAWWD